MAGRDQVGGRAVVVPTLAAEWGGGVLRVRPDTARVTAPIAECEFLMSSAAPVLTASGDESPQSEDAVLARQVAEQAPYGMYVVDSQFRLKQINAEAMPVFHSVPPPMIGRDLGEAMACIWGPELGAVNTAIFRNTLASGERYLSPRYFERRHDLGVDQAFEWEVQRITLPDGRHGLVCYFADVTRRWLDQEALRISEERFRIALDISELGAWELNLADNHAWRSPRHDQVFGYPELLPTWTYEMAREHVLDEDRSAWDEGFRHAVAEKLPWNFEVRIRRADGVLRWIWAYGKYIVDADQQPDDQDDPDDALHGGVLPVQGREYAAW